MGAIAVLILETSLQRGFSHGLAAGSGAASADLLYATVAALLGALVAAWLAPVATPLKLISAFFLVALGGRGLYLAWHRRSAPTAVATVDAPLWRTYLALLSLTLLNPATIAYFAALILAGAVGSSPTLADKLAFIAGVFVASWSWQSFLAVLGALAHRHLPPAFRAYTGLVGNAIIILLGLHLLF